MTLPAPAAADILFVSTAAAVALVAGPMSPPRSHRHGRRAPAGPPNGEEAAAKAAPPGAPAKTAPPLQCRGVDGRAVGASGVRRIDQCAAARAGVHDAILGRPRWRTRIAKTCAVCGRGRIQHRAAAKFLRQRQGNPTSSRPRAALQYKLLAAGRPQRPANDEVRSTTGTLINGDRVRQAATKPRPRSRRRMIHGCTRFPAVAACSCGVELGPVVSVPGT